MEVDFALFAAVGFVAQLIDGAIGMPPALASAAVHVTKIPTGIASGLSPP